MRANCRRAITGTSPLPIISGALNGAPYPTGQILALHLEEPSGATRFQDAAPSHALGTCAGSSCPQTGRPWQYGQAATFDGDDVIELGVHRCLGDLARAGSLTSPPELRIGSIQTNRRFFEGIIDDVQITPYTLSADEVMELYNQPVFRLSMDNLDCDSIYCATYDDMGDVRAEALCINSNSCPEETDGVQKGGIEMKGIPLEVDQHSALSLHAGRFSQSVWVKPTAETPYRQGLWGYSPAWDGDASRSDPSEAAAPSLFIVNTTDLEVGFGDGTTWRGCVFEDLLTLNEWNHVVATYNGNDYVVYIDGQREGTCGIGENPPRESRFDIGRATHCARVENPEVDCINEADHGDTGEFYAYFDDDGWDGKWWYEEGIDDGDTFYPDADPHDYCDNTTLSVEEYDDDDPDDFIDDYGFSYRDPSRDWWRRFTESSDGNDLYLNLIHTNPSIPFEGALDEMALYRRTLSEDDVKALYLAADRIFELDFDETPGRTVFADATANGYAAHCDPAAPATCPDSGMPGRFNQAIRFDGVDDALTINPLRMPWNATVGAWGQPDDPGDESIISYREINPQMGLGLGLEDGKPYVHLGQYRAEGSVAVPDHAWTHLAAVYSYSPYYVSLRLYQDGVLVGQLEQPIVAGDFRPFGYSSAETTLGGKFGDHFAARLDQVVLIRRALSDEEVTQLRDEAPSDSLAWAGGPGGCTWDGAETITCNLPDVSSSTPSHITVRARTRETFGQNYVLRTMASVAPRGVVVDPNTLNNQAGPVLTVLKPWHKVYLPLILKEK